MAPRLFHPGSRRLNRPSAAAVIIVGLAVMALSSTVAFSQTGRWQDGSDFGVLHVMDDTLLVRNVSSSLGHISPPDSCDGPGDGIQDATQLSYTVIGLDSVDVTMYVARADGPIVGAFYRKRSAPGQTYPTTFNGCIFGALGNPSPDGFYSIIVRAIDDTFRVEDTVLPLEIDRKLPVIESIRQTTQAPWFQNGDTVVLEIETDRPSYTFNLATMFRNIDSSTNPALTQFTDHGDGRYTIRHDISSGNVQPDAAGLLIPIDITDEAGNTRRDRSQRICLLNHPPGLVASSILGGRTSFKNGETVRVRTEWDSPNTPLSVAADFANLDSNYDPARVSITELTGNVFELAYTISALNTKPNYPNYRLRVSVHDRACGSVIDTSIVVGLNNAPPRPTHDPVPATTRNAAVQLTGTAVEADRVEIRRNNVVLNTLSVADSAHFSTTVPLVSRQNLITIFALDVIGNRSVPDTVRISREPPPAPVVNSVPASTRDGTVTLTGHATDDAVKVQVRRGIAVIDSVLLDPSRQFQITVPLDPGANTLVVEAANSGGGLSAGTNVSIFRLTEAFVSFPSRFVPGTGSSATHIQLGLPRTGSKVRVEFWNLAGDLMAVVEDETPRDLYTLSWDGRDSGGSAVSGGPVLSRIFIDYVDGGREEHSRAFVLVKP